MKKKYILTGILLLLFTGIGILIAKTIRADNHKKVVSEQLKMIPNFETYNMDSLKVRHTDFNAKPTMIVYFNTDCDHCQYEAIEIEKNILKFKNAQLLMLSIEPLENIRKFIKTYKLEEFSNLKVGQISGKTAVETFGFKSVPHILIYNAENQLVKEFKGETKIEAILKYL